MAHFIWITGRFGRTAEAEIDKLIRDCQCCCNRQDLDVDRVDDRLEYSGEIEDPPGFVEGEIVVFGQGERGEVYGLLDAVEPLMYSYGAYSVDVEINS